MNVVITPDQVNGAGIGTEKVIARRFTPLASSGRSYPARKICRKM